MEAPPDLKDFVATSIRNERAAKSAAKEVVAQEKKAQTDRPCFQGAPPETIEACPRHIEQLRDLFAYDKATGKLWLAFNDPPNLATTPGRNGHGRVSFYTMTAASARVVWLLHHGRWPDGKLGRRDNDVRNDRIENLYEPRVEREQAARRAAMAEPKVFGKRVRKNPSRGVARCGPDHWQAYVRIDGKQKGLGRFKTEAEAIAARAAWDGGLDLV